MKITAETLKERFPWLGTDEPASGADAISELSALYEQMTKTDSTVSADALRRWLYREISIARKQADDARTTEVSGLWQARAAAYHSVLTIVNTLIETM